jgi:hypothetical protein
MVTFCKNQRVNPSHSFRSPAGSRLQPSSWIAARIEARDAVARDQALWLLAERAVLTRAVCRELQDSGGEFYGRRPFRALALLLEWVQSNFPQPVATAENGLDTMVVPEDCQDLLREIRDGADVCDALAMPRRI